MLHFTVTFQFYSESTQFILFNQISLVFFTFQHFTADTIILWIEDLPASSVVFFLRNFILIRNHLSLIQTQFDNLTWYGFNLITSSFSYRDSMLSLHLFSFFFSHDNQKSICYFRIFFNRLRDFLILLSLHI